MSISSIRCSNSSVARVCALTLAVLVPLLVSCTAPKAEEQDKDWANAEDLVVTSDRILVARFADSRLETIQQFDSVTGVSAGEIDVLFRQFEVIETLKGTSDREDLLWVAFEPGPAGELVDGRGDVQEFRDGPTYVLFLKGRLRPLEYPPEFGAVLWTGNGEPSFAVLNGQRLSFWSDPAYLNLIELGDTSLPLPQSASPFELTMAEIESITK